MEEKSKYELVKFNDGELDGMTSLHFLHISNYNSKNRPPEFYNLNVILSIGYRVKSKNLESF